MERLLGTDDLTERLPFSLSKIQEMAKTGEIPMIVFPGSRKYVITETAFESWIRRTYLDGINRMDQGQTIPQSDDQPEVLPPAHQGHFSIRSGKVALKVQQSNQGRKTRFARNKKTLHFDGGNLR